MRGEDARRGQEMEEEGARHYFPWSALQAWVGYFRALSKTGPLVCHILAKLRVGGTLGPCEERWPGPWGKRLWALRERWASRASSTYLLGGGGREPGARAPGEAGPGLRLRRRRAGAAQWWAPLTAFRNERGPERTQYQTVLKYIR
jgi:hypothetical protein